MQFTWSVLEIPRFIVSQRGKPQIVDNRGNIYSKERTHVTKTHWVCVHKHRTNCNARAHTDSGKIVNFAGQHNHLPPEDYIDHSKKDRI